jgi:hypothetical protein
MALLTMPQDHSAADLALAEQLADILELEEMHVFLYVHPRPAPEGLLPRLLAAADELFERVADLVAPWSVPESRQPKTGKLRRAASRSTPV